jgi:hypothetical protein
MVNTHASKGLMVFFFLILKKSNFGNFVVIDISKFKKMYIKIFKEKVWLLGFLFKARWNYVHK